MWRAGAVLLASALALTACDKSVLGRFNGNSKDAMDLYMRVAGTDLSALEALQQKAVTGDQWASLQVGYIYHTGAGGVRLDPQRAADYYLKAARLPVANYNLGLLYANNQAKPDPAEQGTSINAAVVRLQTAAERATDKFVEPIVALAQIYEKGLRMPKNPVLASTWYEKCAAMNDALCQYKLARAFLKGEGRPRNPHQANKWFNMAAERWSTEAQLELAFQFADENYPGYNPYMAARWLLIVAAQKPEYIDLAEAYVAKLGEREQIGARRMAESWLKGHTQKSKPSYNQPTNRLI